MGETVDPKALSEAERIVKCEADINAALGFYGMKIDYELNIPKIDEEKVPDEIMLALSVFKRHGMKVLFTLTPQQLSATK